MDLKQMIYKRKSVRKYKDELVEKELLDKIENFCLGLKPLYDNIKVRAEVVSKENVKSLMPWFPKQAIAIFSEEKQGYLENVGFMFQQLDLYLQSLGLGSCWIGLGKLDASAESKIKDDLKFVIMFSLGYPNEEFRDSESDFNRKKLSEICDKKDERLEPARLAPSSMNSQPWYFVCENDVFHLYKTTNVLHKILHRMNKIDVGISLAHIYISNVDTFKFFKDEKVKKLKGYEYVGSFKI